MSEREVDQIGYGILLLMIVFGVALCLHMDAKIDRIAVAVKRLSPPDGGCR